MELNLFEKIWQVPIKTMDALMTTILRREPVRVELKVSGLLELLQS